MTDGFLILIVAILAGNLVSWNLPIHKPSSTVIFESTALGTGLGILVWVVGR